MSLSWFSCRSSPLVELEFGDVSFCTGRKTGESPSKQGYNHQQTQPTHDTRQKLNPGYIGGRRALSTLLQTCSYANLSTRATNYMFP